MDQQLELLPESTMGAVWQIGKVSEPSPGSIKLPGQITVAQGVGSTEPEEKATFFYEISDKDSRVRFLNPEKELVWSVKFDETLHSAHQPFPHVLKLRLLDAHPLDDSPAPGGTHDALPGEVHITETITSKTTGAPIHNEFSVGILK
jgi:hypothetical protein